MQITGDVCPYKNHPCDCSGECEIQKLECDNDDLESRLWEKDDIAETTDQKIYDLEVQLEVLRQATRDMARKLLYTRRWFLTGDAQWLQKISEI